MENGMLYWNPTGGQSGTGAWEKMQGSGGRGLVTDGQGIRTTRWIDVEPATLPTVAGSGTLTWDDGPVFGVRVESVVLASADTLPLTVLNLAFRWAADAANDAAAGLLLPTTFPAGAPDTEWHQTGSFNVVPVYVPDTEAAGDLRIGMIYIPQGIDIPVSSDGISRLDFAHNLPANMTALIGVSALRVI